MSVECFGQGSKNKYASKKKVFCKKWMDIPEFKGWLKNEPLDPNKCKCLACDKVLVAGKTELIKHSKCQVHLANVKKIKSNKTIVEVFAKQQSEFERVKLHQQSVKRGELLLASFVAEHNIAFLTVDHLVMVMKRIDPNSKIFSEMELHRKKCTALVKNVLAKVEINDLTMILRESVFSILIDESTDIATQKIICCVVQYVDPRNTILQCRLFELLHINGADGTAEKIYSVFKECLRKYNIPLDNITGLACDGASVMVGNHNSFFTRLKIDVPHALLLKCICHSAALVSSKACSKLPEILEDTITGVYSYVTGSAKRCDQLKEMQDYFHVQHYKILKLSGTRWLAVHQCVERLLINWDVLTSFFEIAAYEDGLHSASVLLGNLKNPNIKCYFLFLKYSLNYMNQFNALFQGRQILIHSLHRESVRLTMKICQNFIKPALLKEDFIVQGNILCPTNYLSLQDIFIGTEANALLELLTLDEKRSIKLKVLDFYVCMVEEMKKRLPLKQDIFLEFQFILPNVVFNRARNHILNNLPNLTSHYKDVNFLSMNLALQEWRCLPFHFDENEIKELSQKSLCEMWTILSNVSDFCGQKLFANISKLALVIITLPHSNAECERVFSVVNDVKTKKRNRLGEDTLNAVCVFRSALKSSNDCTNFEIRDEHFQLCNRLIYE